MRAVTCLYSHHRILRSKYQHNAALRGSEVFAKQDIEPLDLELAGFTSFNPKTNIVSNEYKYNGAGVCRSSTQYSWDGCGLRLISSTVRGGRPGGCAEFGAQYGPATLAFSDDNEGREYI